MVPYVEAIPEAGGVILVQTPGVRLGPPTQPWKVPPAAVLRGLPAVAELIVRSTERRATNSLTINECPWWGGGRPAGHRGILRRIGPIYQIITTRPENALPLGYVPNVSHIPLVVIYTVADVHPYRQCPTRDNDSPYEKPQLRSDMSVAARHAANQKFDAYSNDPPVLSVSKDCKDAG